MALPTRTITTSAETTVGPGSDRCQYGAMATCSDSDVDASGGGACRRIERVRGLSIPEATSWGRHHFHQGIDAVTASAELQTRNSADREVCVVATLTCGVFNQ